MNWRYIGAIVGRDLAVVARSKAVLVPIILVPIIFFVFAPFLAGLALRPGFAELAEIAKLIAQLPPSIREQLGDGTPDVMVIRYLYDYGFVTLFLIVPLMVAAVIAADSLAGEKERKTLEALLYTPTTDTELYFAKVLGPWIAAVVVATIGYFMFAIAANLLAPPAVPRPIAVGPLWLVTLLWLNPAVAAFALGVLVLVSARVRGFMEAYQLGAVVVLPVVILVVAQVVGVVYLDHILGIVVGAAVWIIAAGVLRFGYRFFRRERLLLSV